MLIVLGAVSCVFFFWEQSRPPQREFSEGEDAPSSGAHPIRGPITNEAPAQTLVLRSANEGSVVDRRVAFSARDKITGAPIPGALVRLFRKNARVVAACDVIDLGSTGLDGVLLCDATGDAFEGVSLIWMGASGYVSVSETWNAELRQYSAFLERGATLWAKFRDPQGQPVSNATIAVSRCSLPSVALVSGADRRSGPSSRSAVFTARSSEEGTARIEHLPIVSVAFHVRGEGFVPHVDKGLESIELKAGENYVEIELLPILAGAFRVEGDTIVTGRRRSRGRAHLSGLRTREAVRELEHSLRERFPGCWIIVDAASPSGEVPASSSEVELHLDLEKAGEAKGKGRLVPLSELREPLALSIEPTGKRHRYGTLVVDLRDAASMESIPCAFRLDAVGGGVAYTDLESGVARIVRVGSYRLTPLSPVLSRLISTTEVEVEAQSPTRVALRTRSPLRELRLRVEDEWGSMIGPFQLSLNAHGGAMDATLQVAESDARELRSYWIPVARVDLSVEARGFEPQEVTIRESEDLSAPYLVRLKVDG